MIRSSILVAIATALTFASGVAARADQPARPPQALAQVTLAQALQLAIAHNPDSRSTDEDVITADGVLVQSQALPNPSLFVSALGRGISPFTGPTPGQFGVTWTLPLGGKRGAGIRAAEAALDAARTTRIAARRVLELTVEKAFVAVLLDQAQLEFARGDEKDIHDSLELNELRYKDGKIAYGDVLKLRLQVRSVEDATRQVELQLANDRSELMRLTGEGTLTADYKVAGELAPPAAPGEPLSAELLLTTALKHRTDYLSSMSTEQSTEALASQARRMPIPDLGILADVDKVLGAPSAYDITLTVELPLLDRNTGNIKQAESAARKSRLVTEGLRNQIREDVQQAVNMWTTTHARLATYDHDILSDAKESLDITRHAYEQGRGSLLDYLDAETSYRDVERSYRSVVADTINAAATLRFVAGEDL